MAQKKGFALKPQLANHIQEESESKDSFGTDRTESEKIEPVSPSKAPSKKSQKITTPNVKTESESRL